jgi:tryptophan halogenase
MNIVIVGGGTAGWLTSLLLSTKRPQHNYTVIDSSEIGPIGVGEAATGKFTQILNTCGIDILDFIKNTNALPKHALRFVNWAKTPGVFDSPLEYSQSYQQAIDSRLFLQILNDQPIEYASISGIFSRNERTTFNRQLESVYQYALQFDASKTATYLKSQTLKNPINYIDDTIVEIILSNEKITELKTKTGQTITGDLFIDCSGLRRLLISKFNPKFNNASDYIHVNSAMLFKLANDQYPKRTLGVSIARNAGWNFEISTRTRMGRGYVHNSNLVSEDQLIAELTSAYGQPVEKVRTITWEPGSLDTPWISNCIAIGLSASFLEPLQTGAIHDTIMQLQDLLETSLLETVEQTLDPLVINGYNRRCRRLFSDYLDFLSVSYAGGRTDTEFWQWVTDRPKTPRAQYIIDLAKTKLTRELDFDKFMGYGSQGLYNYTLAGLGLFDKSVIQSVFASACIDIDHLNQEQKEFEQLWTDRMSGCLTSVEFNNILIGRLA